jgi:hypothetical protein
MVVVVFKKRKTSKPEMVVYTESKFTIDLILDMSKRKPAIPYNWILEDIGIGKGLVELYQNKHKITKIIYNKVF